MKTYKVLGMVPALSRCSKVYCVHTSFHSFSFQSLSPLEHQYLLMQGLLCTRPVLESSFVSLLENQQRGNRTPSAEGLGLTLICCDLSEGQPSFHL